MLHNSSMRVIGVAAALFLCSLGLQAKDEPGEKPAGHPGQHTSTQSESLQSSHAMAKGVDCKLASKLLDAEVKNKEDVTLGNVKDIVLSADRDKIEYVALGRGGILGMGEQLIAVPWSEFHVGKHEKTSAVSRIPGARMVMESAGQAEEKYLVLDITPDKLKSIQGFKSDAWPSQAQPLASQTTMTPGQEQPMRGTESYGGQGQQFDLRRISKLIGCDVQADLASEETPSRSSQPGSPETRSSTSGMEESRQGRASATGKEIGEIKDVAFNAQNGQLIYCVVSLDKLEQHAGKECVAPWSAIQFQTEPQIARLNVPDTTTLVQFPFDESQHRDLSSREYAQRIFEAYDLQPRWEVLGFVSPEQEGSTMRRESPQQQGSSPMRGTQKPESEPRSGRSSTPRGGY
jgi:sporulation protein YlmC with PRC-barrel domain